MLGQPEQIFSSRERDLSHHSWMWLNCFLFKFKGKWLIIYAAVYFILTLSGNVAHFAGQIGEIF